MIYEYLVILRSGMQAFICIDANSEKEAREKLKKENKKERFSDADITLVSEHKTK